ncbi:MAG: sphingomyelin phosphodiesterase [Benniella sp.]|nr:MAG: sphingomyelin phosphodiesterase [Benniella sp.]
MKFSAILPLAAIATAVMPSFAAAAGNVTISVLTNNVYFLSEILYPNWGQRTRAQLIANSDYIKNHDVIVLQECFANDPCNGLRDGLRSQYPYQTPTVGQTKSGWDSTSGSYSTTAPENGGTLILSKWPITQKHQFVYKNACGADWFSNKGFAYVTINYRGANVHVFGTHMQSDDKGCSAGQAAQCRADALNAWRSYIDGRNIPANELVIMAGDFNIKRDTAEFSSLLTRLNANQPSTYNGHPWTWDTTTNEIAHYNYPNDPSEYIDFVLTDKKHKAVTSAVQTTHKLNSPEYVLKGVAYHEYSDHYPVQTVIEFDL